MGSKSSTVAVELAGEASCLAIGVLDGSRKTMFATSNSRLVKIRSHSAYKCDSHRKSHKPKPFSCTFMGSTSKNTLHRAPRLITGQLCELQVRWVWSIRIRGSKIPAPSHVALQPIGKLATLAILSSEARTKDVPYLRQLCRQHMSIGCRTRPQCDRRYQPPDQRTSCRR